MPAGLAVRIAGRLARRLSPEITSPSSAYGTKKRHERTFPRAHARTRDRCAEKAWPGRNLRFLKDAERRMGELIEREQAAGRLAKQNGGNRNLDSSVSRLSDLGIPHDRSARAQKLAQFEEALADPAQRPTSNRIISR